MKSRVSFRKYRKRLNKSDNLVYNDACNFNNQINFSIRLRVTFIITRCPSWFGKFSQSLKAVNDFRKMWDIG